MYTPYKQYAHVHLTLCSHTILILTGIFSREWFMYTPYKQYAHVHFTLCSHTILILSRSKVSRPHQD
jgi:hypothetical protein